MSTPPNELDPDERCGVCEETRENHGDKNHVFSVEGILIPKKPGPTPSNQPPSARADRVLKDPLTGLVLRLVERLIARNLLDGEDLLHIMGGEHETDRGPTPPRTIADNLRRRSK